MERPRPWGSSTTGAWAPLFQTFHIYVWQLTLVLIAIEHLSLHLGVMWPRWRLQGRTIYFGSSLLLHSRLWLIFPSTCFAEEPCDEHEAVSAREGHGLPHLVVPPSDPLAVGRPLLPQLGQGLPPFPVSFVELNYQGSGLFYKLFRGRALLWTLRRIIQLWDPLVFSRFRSYSDFLRSLLSQQVGEDSIGSPQKKKKKKKKKISQHHICWGFLRSISSELFFPLVVDILVGTVRPSISNYYGPFWNTFCSLVKVNNSIRVKYTEILSFYYFLFSDRELPPYTIGSPESALARSLFIAFPWTSPSRFS